MTAAEDKLAGAWWLLRLVLGAGIFLAGLDKFFGVLTEWSMYLAPVAERLLPVSGDAFLRAAGVGELAIGIALLTRWPRAGAYALSAWLVAVAVNLALAGHFWDLVVRDLEISVSAFTLARLTAWREAALGAAAPASGAPVLQEHRAHP